MCILVNSPIRKNQNVRLFQSFLISMQGGSKEDNSTVVAFNKTSIFTAMVLIERNTFYLNKIISNMKIINIIDNIYSFYTRKEEKLPVMERCWHYANFDIRDISGTALRLWPPPPSRNGLSNVNCQRCALLAEKLFWSVTTLHLTRATCCETNSIC